MLSEGPKADPEQMRHAMQVLPTLLDRGRPWPVSARWSSVVHVYVDVSFDYDGFSGIGGMAYSASCEILAWFRTAVPRHVLDELCTYSLHCYLLYMLSPLT